MKLLIIGITHPSSNNQELLRQTAESISQQVMGDNEVKIILNRYQNSDIETRIKSRFHDLLRTYFGIKLKLIFFAPNRPRFIQIWKIIADVVFLISSKNKRSGKKYAWKQLNLTNKHIFAWQQFLETDSEYLLVLEDDAIENPKNTIEISEVLALIATLKNKAVIVNLINHFDLSELNVESHTTISGMRVGTSRIFANTTGAYLANHLAIEMLFKQILQNPVMRVVGADWMIGLLGNKFPKNVTAVALNLESGLFLNSSLIEMNSTLEN